MNFSLAIMVCLAAYVVAAPTIQISPAQQEMIVNNAIAKLQSMLDATTNPAMQMLIQQQIQKIKNQFNVASREVAIDMQRGFWDTVSSALGLDKIWGIISALHGTTKIKFMELLTKLIMTGGNAITDAKPIFSNLVAQLTGHASNAVPLLDEAIAALQTMLAGHAGSIIGRQAENRAIWDTLASVFGLGDVITTISNLHSGLSDKFFALLEKIVFSGKLVWASALPIINKLHKDLLAHIENVVPLLTAAVAELTGVVGGHISGNSRALDMQRGFWETASSIFGLDKIWGTITTLHGVAKDKFMAVLYKLMFAGTNAWNDAKPIFFNLVSQLSGHAENAIPLLTDAAAAISAILGNHISGGKREISSDFERGIMDSISSIFGLSGIWDTLTNFHGVAKEKFFALLTQVMFSGSEAIKDAKKILLALVGQLSGHAENAKPLLEEAIAALQAMLAGHAGTIMGRQAIDNRAVWDTLASVFGLQGVMDTIVNLHSIASEKFLSLLETVVFSGKEVWKLALPIISKLGQQLIGHASDAQPLLSAAVAELTAVLAGHIIGKREVALDMQRGFWDTVSSMLGLDKIWGTITAFHGVAKDKFFAMLTKIIMTGGNAITDAKPILSALVSQLSGHAENAKPLLEEAVAALQAMLAGHAGSIIGRQAENRAIWDTLASVFGLSDVITTISNLHSGLSDKFFALLEKIVFSGKLVWASALPIINKLHKDLLAHIENVVPLLTAAVAELTGVVGGHISGNSRALDMQRGFWETVSSMFGLDKIWSTLTAMHGSVKDQFFALLTKLMFAGGNAWTDAKPIMSNLVAQLFGHAENATPLVSEAVAALQAVLAGHAGSIIG